MPASPVYLFFCNRITPNAQIHNTAPHGGFRGSCKGVSSDAVQRACPESCKTQSAVSESQLTPTLRELSSLAICIHCIT